MRRLAWLSLALCLGCEAPGEIVNDERLRLANWDEGRPPRPFVAGSPAARACRVELRYDPVDLPAQLPAPKFEALPELEAALNSVDTGGCEAPHTLSYALTTDYDGDGDEDFVVRRPLGPGADCQLITLGVVRDVDGQLGPFEALPGLGHLFLVGSLDGDPHADAVVIEQDCARVLWYREGAGFEHDQSTELACGEGIGDDDNTVTTWDLDRDGDLDLMLTTGGPNYYFRNDSAGGQAGASFVEARGEVGLTPAGAYDYDPDDPRLSQGGEPFDPTRAASFYMYCDHEDPFDPLSPTICQVDNDGAVSFNESYRCDAAGACVWVEDRVDPACDRITATMYSRYLCDARITAPKYEKLVSAASQLLGESAGQATHIAHGSGSPARGDNTNPMSIARFGVWPYAFEYKAQSEGVVTDTVVVYARERARGQTGGWLQFEPYHVDKGRSSNGHEQQSWASAALEDGSGWPVLVSVHGSDGETDAATASDVRPLLEQLLETSLPCLEREPGLPFGLADVGVTVVSPSGRLQTLGEIVDAGDGPRSTGPIAQLGVYKTLAQTWLSPGGAAQAQPHLLLGSFDGVVRAYRVIEQGQLLRLALDPGPGRAPHGYGAVLFVEFDGRLRGPKTVGADGVQPNLGNHRGSWDFGLGEARDATVYVLWPWGELERFSAVPADAGIQLLTHGDGALDPALPDSLAKVLDAGAPTN